MSSTAMQSTVTKDRRVSERKQVELPGVLIFEDGSEPCTIFDISPRGARISASTKVPLDSPVKLKLTAHGEFIGKVAWRGSEYMGLEFLHLGDDLAFEPDLGDKGVRLFS